MEYYYFKRNLSTIAKTQFKADYQTNQTQFEKSRRDINPKRQASLVN